jgi:uracil-DNA glycosylase
MKQLSEPIGLFPFGQPVMVVMQQDCRPKPVFVLGVYASAVHARWRSATGKVKVKALAVASEPEIFWRGEHAAEIIGKIGVPAGMGSLEPAAAMFNGPSGLALDDYFLSPLGLSRADAWLCDLLPHSCVNPAQQAAINREYSKEAEESGLPPASVPAVPAQLADARRRQEILAELTASQAGVLILLGDQPIKWFLAAFDRRRRRLADFGETPHSYGQLHPVNIAGRPLHVLPLVHPRQAGRLGLSSQKWHTLHRQWLEEKAGLLLR